MVSTLRIVDTTIGFVKSVNPISRQVQNTRCHPLSRKGKIPVEVYNEVKTAYGDKAMNRTIVFKMVDICAWWSEEQKTFNILEKIENALYDYRRLTVDELSVMFLQISRSLLHKTITETLGYWELPSRWIPKQLTDQQKFIWVETGQEFFRRYKLHGDEFLCSIVTVVETWVHTTLKRQWGGEGRCGWRGWQGNYFEQGIKKLIPRFTTWIEKNGDYIEK